MTKKYDWQFKIAANLLILRVLGLWPAGHTYTVWDTIYATIILTTFQILHIMVQAINIYFMYDNLMAVTGTIYVLLMEILGIFKCYFLITDMKMLKQLLETLDTDMFQPKNLQQREATEENIRVWNMIYKALLVFYISGNLFWIVYPLMDGLSTKNRLLPFLAWYPYNTSVSPFYEITYVHQVISVNVIAVTHISLDGFVAALIIFNACQFDILADNLRNFHQCKNVKQNLIYCIRHHVEILSFADKSNKFLNLILFTEFTVFAISIGITMFQLTLVIPMSSEFFSYVTFGTAITLQLFMHCFSGNEMEIKSRNIPYAVFECEWFDFPQEVKKNLLFFTMKAQKPVRLSAFNLFYLSLETFVNIMKTSWSYFALLHNVSS